MTKTLVVDACVATSASDKNHPVSTSCRTFLQLLMTTDNKICFNNQLLKEWSDHRSVLSVKVLSYFKSRKKILYLESTHDEVDTIRESLDRIKDKSRIGPIAKDLHLIDAALSTDYSIISRDVRARNHFCSVLDVFPILEQIMWIDPTDQNDNPKEWLVTGSIYDKSKTLKQHVSLRK